MRPSERLNRPREVGIIADVLRASADNPNAAVLGQPATCERLCLRTITVPQKEVFRSAIGVRAERRALIVEWITADGVRGFGEFSGRTDPFFNGEYLAGAIDVLATHLAPRLDRAATAGVYVERADALRGWPFARAAVTDAMFDALRRSGGRDLVDAVATEPAKAVPAGISLGLFGSPEEAVDRVTAAVERGFRRIKLKVTPGMDLAAPRAVRDAFEGMPLLFDANGSGRERDLDFFAALAELDPTAIEQPTVPGRWDILRALRDAVPDLRVCLDEDATGAGVTDAALALGLAHEVNLKPGRVGGQLESLAVLAAAAARDIPVWIGGMFETAIGRYHNLRFAALLPDAPAHDLSPSDRYFDRDLSASPPAMTQDGLVAPAPGPVEIDDDALDAFETDRVTVTPGDPA